MQKHLSKTAIKYINQIKNEDIREAQAAIFVRYTDIEKDPYKCINQSDDDLNNFQIYAFS